MIPPKGYTIWAAGYPPAHYYYWMCQGKKNEVKYRVLSDAVEAAYAHRDRYPEMNKPWKVTITHPEWRKPPAGYTLWWDDAYFWMKDGERSPDYPNIESAVNAAVCHALLHAGK